MPTTIFMSTITGAVAAAGVALTSFVGVNTSPYDNGEMKTLSNFEASTYAEKVFARSDRNGDAVLDVDEFAALTIITAELANLNGFVAVEKDASVETISLPVNSTGALSASEHTRIDAVARHTFYAFAGNDGKMQQGEYIGLQNAIFASSDLNANGALTRTELSIFARRQAYLRPEA
ncbi:hypothetical protein PUV54_15365 [Hyphococcus flavus]|uniref:EF-hand domain-containing protein n=1 Tax=Hyphococcus flavus TaxID=1866326 RepID=A0AAE9ZE38_9PROT|nr:hypothetical protein [Hyphococcus flavus]WDI31327.1 hypothetical protein PUV54_15365 [Hyphococcus flavus]